MDITSINRKIAFNLFREWTKNASTDHPNSDFTIIDETNLINDFRNALQSSIKNLVKEEKADRRKTLGYDFGFIIGFIQGNLNKHWYNEYVLKRTDLYKGFVINKAICEYLKFDNITGIRINALYENLLKEELNLNTFDFSILEKEIKKCEIDYCLKNCNVTQNIKVKLWKRLLEIY